MPLANLEGVAIHYEWIGKEAAPVLVLSNSLGTNYRMWEPQFECFSKHFRVLCYDTRGHGASAVTPGPYTIEQLGNDVIRLLNFLQLDRVLFCGLSMGGTTGMYLGANHPNRFHKLVLCNTGTKLGTLDSWNARIDSVRMGGMRSVSNLLMERWFTFDFRSSHESEVAEIQEMFEATDPEGYIANCAAVRDADMREAVCTISLPTLIVFGKHDPVATQADAQAMAKSIAGSKMVELSAAHLSNVEAHEDFNREVAAFLQA